MRLTQLSHGAGCACKLPPGLIHGLIAEMPRSSDPALLVGHETADDAAVYRVSDELAIVSTVDFFTPIVDDPEPKYGLAVTGAVHPDRIVRNSTARPGDSLFLTKPVGGGVASTALKRGVGSTGLTTAAVEVMTTLNREASEAATAAGASAMTDVTGFGLLGHLHELCVASGVAAEIAAGAVPAIDGVLDLLSREDPPIAGGTRRNRDWVEPWVEWSPEVPEERRWLLCDAMTSGGLIVAAPGDGDAPGVRIGTVVPGDAGRIAVSA